MGERVRALECKKAPHLEVKKLLTHSDSFTCAAINICVLVTVFPPEIASVTLTADQDTQRMMMINSFQTTYGPLK